jgi:uncharacterized protein (TIGR02391 family)
MNYSPNDEPIRIPLTASIEECRQVIGQAVESFRPGDMHFRLEQSMIDLGGSVPCVNVRVSSESLGSGAIGRFFLDPSYPAGAVLRITEGRGAPVSPATAWKRDPDGQLFYQCMNHVVGELEKQHLIDPSALPPQLSSLLPLNTLHPEIVQHVLPLLQSNHLDKAVFEAMKLVEIAVRQKGGFRRQDLGVRLMQQAFKVDPSPGPLTDTTAAVPEQDAMRNLYSGAIGLFKNPGSHHHVSYADVAEVAAMIRLADLLLKMLP